LRIKMVKTIQLYDVACCNPRLKSWAITQSILIITAIIIPNQ
jgi:hypothetical protein